jgi:exosortase D (VPLPA-CTERM-specific)
MALYSTKSDSGLHLHNTDAGTSLPTLRLWVPGLAIICLILVCLAGRNGLLNLFYRWTHEEEYGYGFLIVALVPLLLWRCWHLIAAASSGPRWPGLMVVAAAQVCIVFAALGESYLIEQVAVIATLLGIGMVVFGTGPFRVFAPIALLLLLTIPMPYTLQAILTIKLQMLSTNLGVALIRFIGLPVYVDGNVVDLGTYKIQVAEACSGLRYLLPLTCISFIVAYLYKAPFWKKAVVVVSAAPITILINSFRIAVTAVLVGYFGSGMAEGFLHQFEGWVVFLIGALFLGLELFVLEGFRCSNVAIESIFDQPTAAEHAVDPFKTPLPLILTLLLCVGTLAATNLIASGYRSAPRQTRQSFSEFPREIGRWTAQRGRLDTEIVDTLKATDYYVGDFVEASDTPPVNLFVAYYDSLSRSAAIHSPRVCLPGSGWEFASFEERNFGEIATGVTGTYNYVLIKKGEQEILMYYWFQQRERRTADEFAMKYYLLVDGLSSSRKDGALVRLYTPVVAAAGENAEVEANARLHAFAQAMNLKMSSYLPQ